MTHLVEDDLNRNTITLTVKDKLMLHSNYMPFIKNGGLFIANHTEYELGDDVSILLNLMGAADKISITGKVVWIAQQGVKNPHTPDIGVQFSAADSAAKTQIETYLASGIDPTNLTATM